MRPKQKSSTSQFSQLFSTNKKDGDMDFVFTYLHITKRLIDHMHVLNLFCVSNGSYVRFCVQQFPYARRCIRPSSHSSKKTRIMVRSEVLCVCGIKIGIKCRFIAKSRYFLLYKFCCSIINKIKIQ